jgi:hypothetical protein
MALRVFPRGTRIPKLAATLLDNDSPQVALNADYDAGNLRPINRPTKGYGLTRSGDLRTIYKIGTEWISWPSIVDVVKSQVPESDDRFYFTGDGSPKQSNKTMATSGLPSTYPTQTVALGVQPPSSIITINILGTEDTSKDPVDVSYLYTYVTAWGEESGPSPETAVVTIPGGKYTGLKNFVVPADTHITHLRVYRVNVGFSSAEYQLVKVRPGTLSAEAVDTVPLSEIASVETLLYDSNSPSTPNGLNQALAEVLPSEDWDAPPSGLSNLIQFQNGVLAGSVGNEVCFSETFIPYAWPIKYRKNLGYDVVALGAFRSTVVALTKSYPYLIQGTDPARLTVQRLEHKQKCVSKRGVVSTPDGVIYPSPDGLFMVAGLTPINLTGALFTKAQWSTLGPENLVGFYWDKHYYGFFQGTGYGFALSIEQTPRLREFDLDILVYGGYVDPDTNTLNLLGLDTSYYVYTWGDGALVDYTWKTKTFTFYHTNFSVAQLLGSFEEGPIKVTPIFDGVVYPHTWVHDSNFFWLPSGFTYKKMSFTFEGKSEIDVFTIAHSPEELSRA